MVYHFAGKKLIKTEPLTQYLISKIDGENIILYRKMSSKEKQRWIDKTPFEPHINYSYPDPVFHFSLNRVSSIPFSKGEIEVLTYTIPKSTILRWIHLKKIWAGYLDSGNGQIDQLEYEFVISNELFNELASLAKNS